MGCLGAGPSHRLRRSGRGGPGAPHPATSHGRTRGAVSRGWSVPGARQRREPRAMRLLPPLWLLLALLSGRGEAAPPTDPLAQLPAPQNLKIRLYNAQQVLSWDPVPPPDDTGPVVYQVQYKYTSTKEWSDVVDERINCSRVVAPLCNFTAGQGFVYSFNVSLRVCARQGARASAWVSPPWFQHYRNVTIGPPENLSVKPGGGSLIISFSDPFEISSSDNRVFFRYFVCYWEDWEEATCKKNEDAYKETLIRLTGLRPWRRYCVRVRAQLWQEQGSLSELGSYSDIACSETGRDASTELQQAIGIAVGVFLALAIPVGACLFLVLRYKDLIKAWFHTPPRIPLQIEEYLRDPAQPFLDTLDKGSASTDNTWERVSLVSFPSTR
ncbi:interferon gamma receptor 2 [Sorex araneus]|uniref:interferon gamma receptor 2 n=1 Tax=Sorex araneus TaxID=42254 RepID=UPI002433EA46|nr:interferon gamma receptor 2 [Sorex araneus]